jgi:hypothetical protein
MPDCHETIIGLHTDLLRHIDGAHPLAKGVDYDGERSILDAVKDAQQAALKADIRERMYVDRPSADSKRSQECR